jgi:PAS domain S-box-containing protein
MADVSNPLAPSGHEPSESRDSILLVDDNPANLLSLRTILDDLGHNLLEARSGEEAIEHAKTDEFAVILLDVRMPGINGFETAKAIRGQGRSLHTPIIFLTAADIDRAEMEKGYALGAADFLVKPIMAVALRAKVRGFVQLFQDKQQAKQEADQLRLLVHGTTEYAIFMLDPQGRVASWNAGAERIKQYKSAEIIGQHFTTFYPQEAIDRGWPTHELKVATTAGRFEDESWRIRKDGSQFWANVVITALKDDHGKLRGFSKITRDMTERKKSEADARRLVEEATARRVAEENVRLVQEQRERLHVTLASIGDAVISTDAEGRVDFLNPVAENLVGWKTKEAARQTLADVFCIVNEDTRQPVENPALRALQQGVVVGLANHTVLIAKDGKECPIDDSAAPIRDTGGNVVGSVLVFRDISEKKRDEAALKERVRLLTLNAAVGAALVQADQLRPMLQRCAEALVEHLHGAFARIWTLNPQGDVLELQASAGRYTHLDGPHSRVPVGQYKIGLIAQERRPHLTNAVAVDPRVSDQEWAQREGMVAFAGYPLLVDDRLVGVMAMFARQPLSDATVEAMASVANGIAVGVERKVAEVELRRSEQELADFFENATVGLHWVGADGTILRANRAELDMLGYSREEYVGRPIADFHADKDTICDIPSRLKAGEKLDEYPARLRCKDGSIRDVLIDSSVLWKDSRFVHTRCFTRDVTERKRAERQLRASEQRFARFMQYLPGLAWIKDVRGRYVYANDAAEKAFGTARAELYGKTDAEVFPPETAAQFERNDKQALSSGTGVQVVEVLELDNEVRHSLVIKFPILGSDGQVALVGGMAIDITEQRQVEQALRHSEERFRNLMEQAPFSVQVFSPDGRTSRVNRAWEELWGVTLDQIGDYNVLEDPQLQAKGVLSDIHRAFAGEPAFVPAIQYDPNETIPDLTKHADPVRWVTAVAYPLKDDAGRVREVVLVHQDITAQRRAEAALRESEAKLSLLADTIPQLAWMARPDGHIFWYNRRWYEYTGTTPEQMEGWGWQSVHDPEVLPKVLERWKGSIASGAPFDMVFPIKGADDQFRPFLTRVNPLRDENGRILYWFGTNTDISEIKRMEEALRDADRRKDEFLATLAHELRNPLAPIRNVLQILKMPRVDAATVGRSRDMMERQVEHLVRLVDDLLDVSRVMRGKIELRRERVELATVVASAVETVQLLMDAQGHQLSVRLTADSLLIDADPVRIAQVIGNLLTNAAKYTEPHGRIWLTAEREGGMAVLRVRDTGIGIAPQMLPRIFELFVQVDSASTKAQGGLGIGLTLVKNLVEMHNGRVEARSAGLGQGSEFTVRLPLLAPLPDQDHRPEEGRPDDPVPLPSGHRLLVVDDNRDAADSLAMLLGLQGHEVRVAYSGMAALEMTETYTPDMVFLDIGMPEMDGYEAARRLREQPGLEKVVLAALTGWGQKEDRRRTAEAGFDHHLVKPPEPKAVESVLAELKQPDGR